MFFHPEPMEEVKQRGADLPKTFLGPCSVIDARSSIKGRFYHPLMNHICSNWIRNSSPYFPRLHSWHINSSIWQHPIHSPALTFLDLQDVEIINLLKGTPRFFVINNWLKATCSSIPTKAMAIMLERGKQIYTWSSYNKNWWFLAQFSLGRHCGLKYGTFPIYKLSIWLQTHQEL